MSVSAARFEIGRRPGFFSHLGLAGGRNGSIRVHSSSSRIGVLISSDSAVPMPQVNSAPQKLIVVRGFFDTVSKRKSAHVTSHAAAKFRYALINIGNAESILRLASTPFRSWSKDSS